MKRGNPKPLKYPLCPCCGFRRGRKEMKIVIHDSQLVYDSMFRNNSEKKTDTYPFFINYKEKAWACDLCLVEGKAIRGQKEKQNYAISGPFYAYFDTSHTCRTCGNTFIYSKEDKQFWYEELGKWRNSEAVNCNSCRKKTREVKKRNNFLSTVLQKEEETLTIEELEKIISTYKEWEKSDRVKYFQSVLRKKLKKT